MGFKCKMVWGLALLMLSHRIANKSGGQAKPLNPLWTRHCDSNAYQNLGYVCSMLSYNRNSYKNVKVSNLLYLENRRLIIIHE